MTIAVPSQIHQVIINLCTNAYQAIGGEKGSIDIRLEQATIAEESPQSYPNLAKGDYAKLTIADDGEGMDEHIKEHIFEPFFSTKDVGYNVGLGLAVVHGIVQKHYGQIYVFSQKGVGTRFEVYFPIIHNDEPFKRANSKNKMHGQEHILFVDDEEENAMMGKDLLERAGYQVTICTNSEDVLDLVAAQQNPIQCLITDYAMPNMDGMELIKEVRAHYPNLPVILMSGFADLHVEEESEKNNVQALLKKPIPRNDLYSILRKILDSKDGDA